MMGATSLEQGQSTENKQTHISYDLRNSKQRVMFTQKKNSSTTSKPQTVEY